MDHEFKCEKWNHISTSEKNRWIPLNFSVKKRCQTMTQNPEATKWNIGELDMAKTIRNKVKRQLENWEKIFATHKTDKGLKSLICRDLLKIETEDEIFKRKMRKDFNRQFTHTHTHTHTDQNGPQAYEKICKHTRKDMQIKSCKLSLRYSFPAITMAKVKTIFSWPGCEETGPLSC